MLFYVKVLVKTEPFLTDNEPVEKSFTVKEEELEYDGITIYFENAEDEIACDGKCVLNLILNFSISNGGDWR